MKIVLLTQRKSGSPLHFLKKAYEENKIELVAVVLSAGEVPNKKKHYLKKIKKIMQKGLGVIVSGILLRSYFDEQAYLDTHETIDEWCKEKNIKLINIKRTNSPFANDIDRLKELDFDYGISIGNSFVSPKIFSLANKCFLNIHHEILPEFTGAQSIIWQIYEGSSSSGFSIHQMSNKIDEGKLLLQEKHNLRFKSDLKGTVQYNLKLIKERSNDLLIKFLIGEISDQEINISKRERRHYTTPNLLEYWKIKRQFKKLSSKLSE